MRVDDLSWHDGRLAGWRFSASDARSAFVELSLWLYREQLHSAERRQVTLRCVGPRRFLMSCDVAELKNNAGAGNIVDGLRKGRLLRIVLTGGFIEVDASSFVVSARKNVAQRAVRAK